MYLLHTKANYAWLQLYNVELGQSAVYFVLAGLGISYSRSSLADSPLYGIGEATIHPRAISPVRFRPFFNPMETSIICGAGAGRWIATYKY